MSEFVLVSDSTLDLPDDCCTQYDIKVIPMEYTIEGNAYIHHTSGGDLTQKEFYNLIREGKMPTTTQINYNKFYEFFEEILKDGKDIIYIAFSSGLSGTYNTSLMAVRDLRNKYPDRLIAVIDSLCASIGEGLLVYNTAKKMSSGCTFKETVKYISSNKLKVCHWFVVDDLEHLKRGGRISAVSATIGKVLQVKPLLSVNNDGELIPVERIRGNNKVTDKLLHILTTHSEDLKNQTIIIGHADDLAKAEALRDIILEKNIVENVIISEIGPIIGSHVGSGMLAFTFIGTRCLKA